MNSNVLTKEEELESIYQSTHARRRTVMREKYGEELKRLEVKDPSTGLYAFALVITQFILTLAMAEVSLWVSLALAFGVGAFICHALWVLIHDMGHGLAFQTKEYNIAGVVLANMPHVLPTSVEFVYWHRKHHASLNNEFLDPDVPSEWEARLFGNTSIGKALWIFFNPFIQAVRLRRFERPANQFIRSAMLFNIVACLAYTSTVWHLAGSGGLWYAFWSSAFAVGAFHPLSARWIAEHANAHASRRQETYSYYGSLNQIIFNIGYHQEHHDHPTVPLFNLPAVKALAPEFYSSMATHTSYCWLLWDFIVNPCYTLNGVSRTVHKNISVGYT